MRYLASVAVIAVVVALALKAVSAESASGPRVDLLAITAAQSLTPGEHTAVYGGLKLPKGTFEIGVWTCSGQTCVRTSWLRLQGPGTYWRWLGSEAAPRSTAGRVILRVYDVGSPFGGLVGEWSQRVTLE